MLSLGALLRAIAVGDQKAYYGEQVGKDVPAGWTKNLSKHVFPFLSFPILPFRNYYTE
jgi:hypothetical protein